jgi:hypothetical protein
MAYPTFRALEDALGLRRWRQCDGAHLTTCPPKATASSFAVRIANISAVS